MCYKVVWGGFEVVWGGLGCFHSPPTFRSQATKFPEKFNVSTLFH